MTNKQLQKIKACIAGTIRQQVQSHGGDIEFVAFDGAVVIVKLKGACTGCPLSFYTLTMGILTELQKIDPAIKEVVQVD